MLKLFKHLVLMLFYTKVNGEKGIEKCIKDGIINVYHSCIFWMFNHWRYDTKKILSETSTLENGLAETSMAETF